MNKSETQKYVCELREEIARLKENVEYYKDSLSRSEKNCNKLHHENKELKQRIAELESGETEKPKKRIGVIVAKEIDGQIYVTFDDFMSVVNDLQAEYALKNAKW